jgi:hypothetical protein
MTHLVQMLTVRLAPILTALFEATSRWKGPRYLAYDTYDARLRTFFTWPKHIHPSPTALSTAGFFHADKNIISLSYIVSYRVHKQFTIVTFTVGTSDKTMFPLRGGPDAGGECLGGARDLVTILCVRAVH